MNGIIDGMLALLSGSDATASEPNALVLVDGALMANASEAASLEAERARMMSVLSAAEQAERANALAGARGDADAKRTLADAVARRRDAEDHIRHIDFAVAELAQTREALNAQRTAAARLQDEADLHAKSAAHVDDGAALAEQLDAVVAHIEKFIDADVALSALAQRMGLYVPAPLANRLTFALSHHVLTDKIRRAVGGTALELSVTFSRHRGGLSFEEIAVPPAATQLSAVQPPADDAETVDADDDTMTE